MLNFGWVFPKDLKYPLPNFIIIWQCYFCHEEAHLAQTGLSLLHHMSSQAAPELIFLQRKSTPLTELD